MKKQIKSALIASFALLPAASAEDVGYGFLNIVNLIPGDIPAEITIDGKKLMPEGIPAGIATGWFMVPKSEKSMSISLDQPEDTEPKIRMASGTIPIEEGISNLVTVFLHPDIRQNRDGKPSPPVIRIRSFPAYGEKGFALRLVSTSAETHRFAFGPNNIEAKPFEIIQIPNWNGGGFEIMHNGKAIGQTTPNTEPGPFYLFISQNPEGEFVTVLTRSGKQSVPPWFETKNKENP